MIEVGISLEEIVNIPNIAVIESYCIGKLKKAGIPIKGILIFEGLEEGQLTRHSDFKTNTIKYIWVKKRIKNDKKTVLSKEI